MSAGRARFRPGGPRIASVGRGSDHKPAVCTEDRLGAKEPKNQGKNISRCSHGFLPLHIRRTMRRVREGFIIFRWFLRPDDENHSERGTFSVISWEDRVGFYNAGDKCGRCGCVRRDHAPACINHPKCKGFSAPKSHKAKKR